MTTVIQFPERSASPLSEVVSGEVRALMGRFSVTQTELAEWLDLKQSAVSARLNGTTRWSLPEIEQVAEAFDVHPAVLMGGYATGPHPGPGEGLPIQRARRYSKPQPSDPKVLPFRVAA